jgi:RNA polymerase sigma-70 factor (ECF subfamily)
MVPEARAVTEQSLRKLVRQHYDRLFRAARFMCGDVTAAEDLVQDTFLAAAASLKNFEGRSSTYTWLYGILLNKFRHWLRRKDAAVASLHLPGAEDGGAAPEEFLPSRDPGPEQLAERQELTRIVRDVVDGLSADHRSVVTLRFVEGMSYEEIAAALDCPIGTVKSRIHYALLRIAEKLAEEGVTPPGA